MTDSEKTKLTIKQLENAKAHLMRVGWRQLSIGWRSSACCILGALQWANPSSKGLEEGRQAFQLLNKKTGSASFVTNLTRWNDAPGRTVEEVYALIDSSLEELYKELAS